MKKLLLLVLLFPLSSEIQAAVTVYEQPAGSSGAVLGSSFKTGDGSAFDRYVWDRFTLSESLSIAGVQWRGGFNSGIAGSSSSVLNFTVGFYASIPAGTEPDVINPPLVSYPIVGNANQTLAGDFGGNTLYDYSLTLPTAFQAQAGTKYWVQIEAEQSLNPNWGLATSSGGDNMYFLRSEVPIHNSYRTVFGDDTAFSLVSPVPEPASSVLLVGTLLVFTLRRRIGQGISAAKRGVRRQ